MRPFFSKRLAQISLMMLGFWLSTAQADATATPVFVSAEWVYQHQDKLKLMDLSSQEDYRKFHIENALWVNYAWLIKPQNGLQLSGGASYMTKVLGQLGIAPTDHVILYDNQGNLDASRLYWELSKLGHQKVSLLDGGTVSWVLKGYPVTQILPTRKPTEYPLPATDFTDAMTADKQEVLSAIEQSNAVLLDTRTEPEYLGDPKQPRSGHLPGAHFFPWEASVDATQGYRQRDAKQLQAFLKQVNLTDPKQPVILYCNTAHRAARLFPMFKSLGYKHVKLYDGSTQEWALDKRLPMKTGNQP